MSTPQLPGSSYDTQDTARLAFMLKLVDMLHSMPDASAIEDVACRMLAEHLGVGFAWFGEIGPDRQQTAIRSEFIRDRSGGLARIYPCPHLQSMVKVIGAEQPYIIDDAVPSLDIESGVHSFHEDRRMRSCMAFPVTKGQQVMTYIAVAYDIPHHWTAYEVSLVHETAVRLGDAIRRTGPTLLKSERGLTLALASARMGVFEWRPGGHRLPLSDISAAVFGLMPGEAFPTGDAYLNLIHTDDRDRHRQTFEHAGTKGEDYHCLYRIVRPIDGQTAWIEERGCGYKDARTGVTGIVGIHWDVTQRIIAEEQTKSLLLLREERAGLMQKLHAQVARLHKMIDRQSVPTDANNSPCCSPDRSAGSP